MFAWGNRVLLTLALALPGSVSAQEGCGQLAEVFVCLDGTIWEGAVLQTPRPDSVYAEAGGFGLRVAHSEFLYEAADADRAATRDALILRRVVRAQEADLLAEIPADATGHGWTSAAFTGNGLVALASAQRIGQRRYVVMSFADGTAVTPELEAVHERAVVTLRPNPDLAHLPCYTLSNSQVCIGESRWHELREARGAVDASLNAPREDALEMAVISVPEARAAELRGEDLQALLDTFAGNMGEAIAVDLPVPSVAIVLDEMVMISSVVDLGTDMLRVQTRLEEDTLSDDHLAAHREALAMIRPAP